MSINTQRVRRPIGASHTLRCWDMLAALVGIVLKINEELSYATGKGGLDACYLVDWPLAEE